MSKLLYMLTFFMMAFSVNAYAQEEIECTEDQTFDTELSICVDNPVPAPAEEEPAE